MSINEVITFILVIIIWSCITFLMTSAHLGALERKLSKSNECILDLAKVIDERTAAIKQLQKELDAAKIEYHNRLLYLESKQEDDGR